MTDVFEQAFASSIESHEQGVFPQPGYRFKSFFPIHAFRTRVLRASYARNVEGERLNNPAAVFTDEFER